MKVKPPIPNDEYEFTVKFKRSVSADLDVIGKDRINTPNRALLLQQLRKELQATYDHPDTAIAGSFDIVSGPTFQWYKDSE